MNNYADIITYSRPSTHRRRMPLRDRAKIFAPFAALKGYEDTVRRKERVLVPRRILADYSQEQLDMKLRAIKRGENITVTFFQSEKHTDDLDLGTYMNITDTVHHVDAITQTLILSKCEIHFGDILDIQSLSCVRICDDFLE